MENFTRNTTTGLKFEKVCEIISSGEKIDKNNLYSFLKMKGINWKEHISRKLLPDDGYYYEKDKTIILFEKKFQKVEGSADEKPQTCAFKIWEYKKLFKSIGVEKFFFCYIFNDWFKKEKYKDMLEYIKTVPNCDYIFYKKGEIIDADKQRLSYCKNRQSK